MIVTKTITGANTKFFVEYADDLIKKSEFDKIIANMILDAYETGVDPMQLKEYLRSSMDFAVMYMMIETDSQFKSMIERRNKGEFNLCDEEVLASAASAAYEAWKDITK